MIEGFLLGVVACTSLVASVFFLKFWRQSRDFLFLAFSIAFFIEAINRTSILFLDKPNEGSPIIYWVRFLAFFIIVIAILIKNRRIS